MRLITMYISLVSVGDFAAGKKVLANPISEGAYIVQVQVANNMLKAHKIRNMYEIAADEDYWESKEEIVIGGFANE